MKIKLLSSTALVLVAGQALATSGIYVAPKVGWSNGDINDVNFVSRYSSGKLASLGPFPEQDDSNSSVVSWGGAVGYKYDSWKLPLRMETEYLYRNHYEFDTGICTQAEGCSFASQTPFSSTIDSQTILANFYLDFPFHKMFAVFIGAGLGAALNFTSSVAIASGASVLKGHMHDYAFSWMGTAGVTFSPIDWLAIDVSYRYSDLGDIEWRLNGEGGGRAFGMMSGHTSNNVITLDSDTFAAQEVYLGIRLQIPDFAQL